MVAPTVNNNGWNETRCSVEEVRTVILDEAIAYAIEGNAILFLGAGFSAGAENMAERDFPLGSSLCERLILDGKIDVTGDSESDRKDLGYISERYLETNTRQDLLSFLKKEFTCKKYSDAHKTISQVTWKRIYTTNYDNIIECASLALGMKRESIDPDTRPSDVLQCSNSIIHMNGYIGNVTEAKLSSTFKLLTSSYQRRTIPNSDWAISLHNDIQNAKCLIFIGYSMDYDLELQQIFAESRDIKDKCVFITWNPSRRALTNMQRFGSTEDIGVNGFAAKLETAAAAYYPVKKEYELRCLQKIDVDSIDPAVAITDKSVTDLFFNGVIEMKNIFSVHRPQYIVERVCCQEIEQYITGDYRAVIIHSDIGNGKSVILRELESRLVTRGTVFYLEQLNSFVQDDMEYICSLRGVKYIVIENYNRIIDSEYVKLFGRFQRDDIRFIFSVRSYLNENLYQRFLERFGIEEKNILMYDVNTLSHAECRKMCSLLDQYSLWGKRSGKRPAEKMRYLERDCHSEMKSIMLDLLQSEEMQRKVTRLLGTLFQDRDLKEITLLLFICETIAIELKLDDIVILLNKQVKTPVVLKNTDIREFFDFDGNHIKLKSPLVAYFILQHYNYNEDVESILRKILPVLDRHSSIERYRNMLRMLISYSNLRMIYSRKDRFYYERFIHIFELSKTLTYHKENPFFWLQYAIVQMEMKEYKTAGIYLENAESYSHKRFDSDSWQIDTHKARLLLEQTVYEKNEKDAFVNFETAYHLLHDNKTPDLHYPLRQVSLFENYYRTFYKKFSDSERNLFLYYCIEMQKMISVYLASPKAAARKNTRANDDIRRIERTLEKMRREMAVSSPAGKKV